MRLIGRVSYPLYLTHPIALALAAAVIAPGGLVTELVYLGVGDLALARARVRPSPSRGEAPG